ncbi:DNA polymerase beta superfamily protein [Micromonospora sp. NPDC049366]|uniref:nucleotidyltransferase domain-containing protein n=1 Tax=Micromonospora sp. NPDC049366 TaxID=3364271 RepID=UPI0037AF5A25
MHILLSGIVGSQAYGLARPGSDTDRLGIFAAPTQALFGLDLGVITDASIVQTPDITLHEARKAAQLLLTVNPTITELLWLPDALYENRTSLGDELIAIRSTLLSAPRVRDAYLGYAREQVRRLRDRGEGSPDPRRRAKHARHLARVMKQGLQLYETGHLTLRLADPEWYMSFGEAVAAGALWVAEGLLDDTVRRMTHTRTPLPDKPDPRPIEAWLQRVRHANLTADEAA